MMFTRLLRTLRTVSHLRLSQVAWRLHYSFEQKLPARFSFGNRHMLNPRKLSPNFPLIPVVQSNSCGVESVEGLIHGRIQLLNRMEFFDRAGINWHLGANPSNRLWTVTLHCHQWVYSLAEVAASDPTAAKEPFHVMQQLLSDWIAHCDLEKSGARYLAWNSYAIASRICWWIRSYLLVPRGLWETTSEFEETFLSSLWKQVMYLNNHLEYDILGNHILRNAVGLVWAGRFFDDPEARRWLRTGTDIALSQAQEQVLADGGHIERSPMYHLHVMEDFLSLGILLDDAPARLAMRHAWERMAECVTWLSHPDGKIPLFNDSALNGACTPEQMLSQGAALGWSSKCVAKRGGRFFPHLGLFVYQGNIWTVFFDVGPIGVDYQPGHGHADNLSIEASVNGQRLWVDPGTWGYDLDERREYDRSTMSHNTVSFDCSDSSEVWGIFRCGRRAFPADMQLRINEQGFSVSAGHDGYRHISGSPIHRREVTLGPDQCLVITDHCEGSGNHYLSAGWLLAPGWSANRCHDGWRVSWPGVAKLKITISGPSGLRLQESLRWYHPEFGKELLTTRLEWVLKTTLPATIKTIQKPEL